MSHVITEAATFDPSVTVPDGTDSGALRAANVTSIAQVLANRTRYLKPLADGAAQKSGGNTWTGTNNFGAVNTAALTAQSLSVTPGATTLGALTAGASTLGAVLAPSYLYTAPLLRQLVIDLRDGTSVSPAIGSGLPQARFVEGQGVMFSELSGGGGIWTVPLNLPHGGVIGLNGLRVIFTQAAANGVIFDLFETQINWTTGVRTQVGIGTPSQTFAGTGTIVTNLNMPAYSVDRQTKALFLVAVSTLETISTMWNGLRVTYSDLGPTSHWQ